mmetsp:Transcript_3899/g.11278  ORF Transcript_3899/g.11278 Transcript_3899/m.11278 type:complete len:166 (-) Transcript_3899:766-1263(-)
MLSHHVLRRVPSRLAAARVFRLASSSAAAAATEAQKPLSFVADVTVNCTFIKPDGKKETVPGRVGWSLLKTAQYHGLPLDGFEARPAWWEDYGDGPSTTADHVVVSRDWFVKLGPIYEEEVRMLDTVEHSTSTSRLSATIHLTKDLDGITVYIPPGNMDLSKYNA